MGTTCLRLSAQGPSRSCPAVRLTGQRRALVPRTVPGRSACARRPVRSLSTVTTATWLTGTPSTSVAYPGDDRDEWVEESQKYRRVTFDFEKWSNHRSQDRKVRHLTTMVASRVVRGLWLPVVYVMGIAGAIVLYDFLYQEHILQDVLPAWLPLIPVSAVRAEVPVALSSAPMALLLAYRTSASYQRFDEARKAWGLCVNRCRDLMRQATGWMDPVEDAAQLAAFSRWLTALPWSMTFHFRASEDLRALLTTELWSVSRYGLLQEEIDYVLQAPHKPNTVLEACSAIIWSTSMPCGRKHSMDENLTAFSDVVGGCERILRTPIPLAYTRHTARFMMLWLTFMPFVLYNKLGVPAIPASAVVAFLLLGIEEIGVNMEEPFSVLPLEAISTTISKNITEHMEHLKLASSIRRPAQWDGPTSPWDDGKAEVSVPPSQLPPRD